MQTTKTRLSRTPFYGARGLYEGDRPPRRVVDAGKTAVLHSWTVPLDQGGRRVEIWGETVWKPVSRPSG